MIRGNRVLAICMLLAGLCVAGCEATEDPAASAPTSAVTTDTAAVDQQAVGDAFARYWDEKVRIAAAGKVPENAFKKVAIGALLEDEVQYLKQDAEHGTTWTGAPRFKNQRTTVDGDSALVVTCVNFDDWKGVLADGRTMAGDEGWRQLGRELRKVDGVWLISGYSPENTKDSCP